MDFDREMPVVTDVPPQTDSARGARAEKREAQIARILDAARWCFVQSGFRGASMNDICRKAEMSPGALYRYFASKEALIEAIAEQDRRQDMATMARIGDSDNLMDGFMDAIMAHFLEVHDRGKAPLFTEIRAESKRNTAVAECCNKSEQQFVELFTAFLTIAKSKGSINPVTDISAIVPMMMALGEGMIMKDPIGKGVAPEKIEMIIRAMTEAVLRPCPSPDNAIIA